MPFVAGMWYGGDYLTVLQTSTGMTPAETTAFYDALDPTSFGAALSAMCDAMSTFYSCVNSANCTNDELALLQWGSSFVTKTPLYSVVNDPYTPVQTSVVGWGDYGFADLTIAPEYVFYVDQQASNAYLNVT
jgi:hypothetical protein